MALSGGKLFFEPIVPTDLPGMQGAREVAEQALGRSRELTQQGWQAIGPQATPNGMSPNPMAGASMFWNTSLPNVQEQVDQGTISFGSPVDQQPQQAGPYSEGLFSEGSVLLNEIDKREGGGAYDTLFGYAQRPGGGDPFDNYDVSTKTIGDLKRFSKVGGEYGNWVKSQIGRTATPMGRFQIVGTTLRNTAAAMNLPDSTVFDANTQRSMANYLAANRLKGQSTMAGKRQALRNEWEGLKYTSDSILDQAISQMEKVL